jgi:hypothetical protein
VSKFPERLGIQVLETSQIYLVVNVIAVRQETRSVGRQVFGERWEGEPRVWSRPPRCGEATLNFFKPSHGISNIITLLARYPGDS